MGMELIITGITGELTRGVQMSALINGAGPTY